MPAPLLSAHRISPPSGRGPRLIVTAFGLALLAAAFGNRELDLGSALIAGLVVAGAIGVWFQASVAAVLVSASAAVFAFHHPGHDGWWIGGFVDYAILAALVAWHSGRWLRQAESPLVENVTVEGPPDGAPTVPFLAPRLLALGAVLGALGGALLLDGRSTAVFAAAALAGVGACAGARAILTDRWRRQLFTRAQPTFEVRAEVAAGGAKVYATDAEDGDQPMLTVAFTGPAADACDGPAVLIGLPMPGAWCTLRLADRVPVPAGEALG
jgi:hypothetical protein